jgi:Tol biopolymer transport system component
MNAAPAGTARRIGIVAIAIALIAVAATVATQSARGAFPGENGRIAYTQTKNGDPEIFTVKPNGHDRHQVTHIGIDGAFEPSYSGNGKKLAFCTNQNTYEVITINSDGNHMHVFPHPMGVAECSPTFSRSGERVAYISSRDGDNEVWTANPRGGDRHQVTHNDDEETAPAFGPHGELAFSSDADGDHEIFVKKPGHDPHQITHNGLADLFPDFSPNGKRIVFARTNGVGNVDVYSMKAGGGHDKRRLTKDPEFDTSPAYSPNGEKIIFESRRDGDDEIFVMNANGKSEHRVTDNDIADDTPNWQPLPR